MVGAGDAQDGEGEPRLGDAARGACRPHAAGRCLRLYTQADFTARPEHDTPEIMRADLAQTYLELAVAGALDVDWFEPPPDAAMRAARTLLVQLGALGAKGEVTALGERMARAPLHPRQARVLVEAESRGVAEDGAVVAAILGERDLRLEQRASFGQGPRTRDAATEPSDVLALLALYREAEASSFSDSILRTLDLDRTKPARSRAPPTHPARARARALTVAEADEALLRAILSGYPDRVARRGKGGRWRSRSAGPPSCRRGASCATRRGSWRWTPRSTGARWWCAAACPAAIVRAPGDRESARG